ncbi:MULTISPECIES: TnsA endonuclease N-terminal domain-containing protein [unclassified Massilia]|uniref:TnsA endonuclease N-terminal domain-containing protein n=1 Tax=unclassified Massilia TaxID=2609279 RepID=UPI0009E89C35|nr:MULTISPECIES: TnsA endonuclease N-terminal domain-containing protein [unclassified Massilia]
MAKKQYTRNESDIQELLRKGRGKGIGENYVPYLYVRDVPSLGRSHRVYGKRSGRVHHLLSDIEYAHYLTFDMDDSVIDIREQFALNRDETMIIASRLGYRHPKDPKSNTYSVMTTDLVITYRNRASPTHKAFSIKPASQLQKTRVGEKLEIEEAYWTEKNISFKVLTEHDIPVHLKRSLQWLRQYHDISKFIEPYPGHFDALAKHILICVATSHAFDITLCEICTLLDKHLTYEPGSHLMIARHMLSTRMLLTNLNREQIWNTPISDIKIHPKLHANC